MYDEHEGESQNMAQGGGAYMYMYILLTRLVPAEHPAIVPWQRRGGGLEVFLFPCGHMLGGIIILWPDPQALFL